MAATQTQHKHGRFLRVASVLLFIYGILGLLSDATFAFAIYKVSPEEIITGFDFELAIDITDSNVLRELLIAYCILDIIQNILLIAAGVAGLRVAKGKGRAVTCEVLAIVTVGLSLLSYLISTFGFGANNSIILDFILSMALPILYAIASRVEATSAFWREFEETSRQSVAESYETVDSAIRHSAIDVDEKLITGTLAIPEQKLPEWLRADLGIQSTGFITTTFSITDAGLRFETEDPHFLRIIEYFEKTKPAYDSNLSGRSQGAAELIRLFKAIMKDDTVLITEWTDRLHAVEELINKSNVKIPKDIGTSITDARNATHAIKRFYKQVADICEALASADDQTLDRTSKRKLKALASKADQLAADASEASEYAMQVRMLQQSQTSTTQAEITTVLTVVATICMSVSLISGWYGMNLDYMPDRHSPFMYLIVIAVCIVLVTAELIYFKRKKWF